MNQTGKISTPQSSELISTWARELEALDDRLRASGRTVTVKEPSDTTEFVATFPQGKRPSAKPQDGSPST